MAIEFDCCCILIILVYIIIIYTIANATSPKFTKQITPETPNEWNIFQNDSFYNQSGWDFENFTSFSNDTT